MPLPAAVGRFTSSMSFCWQCRQFPSLAVQQWVHFCFVVLNFTYFLNVNSQKLNSKFKYHAYSLRMLIPMVQRGKLFTEINMRSQAQWLMPVTPAFMIRNQEDQEFQDILSYIDPGLPGLHKTQT